MDVYVDCEYCEKPVLCREDGDIEKHMAGCSFRPVTAEEFNVVAEQVAEIHQFCSNLAEALQGLEKNPMIRTMLGL